VPVWTLKRVVTTLDASINFTLRVAPKRWIPAHQRKKNHPNAPHVTLTIVAFGDDLKTNAKRQRSRCTRHEQEQAKEEQKYLGCYVVRCTNMFL
jgi:acyl-CoA hydrolase